MKTAKLFYSAGGQVVRLPDEFRFDSDTVSIRREGEAVILEPFRPPRWPDGFFEAIRIDDPAFYRSDQGETPPAPSLD